MERLVWKYLEPLEDHVILMCYRNRVTVFQVNAGDSAAEMSVRLTEVYQELEVTTTI